MVYPGDGDTVDTAVQDLGDSVRVQTILPDSQVDSFSYEFEGAIPVARADGGVDLVRAAAAPGGHFKTIVAALDAPWAIDANGDDVRTAYQIAGQTVTQKVFVTSETAYPVVADPKMTFGVGIYLSLNTLEVRVLALAVNSMATVSAAAGCVVLSERIKVAQAVPWVKYACGAVGFNPLMNTLKALPSRVAADYTASCYQARVPPTQPAWKVVGSSQCVPLNQSWTW
ncbi:hypothetical protein ACFUMH_13965 [Cellulomonas sp. NPDC057328]|uniref:hypothetical protein n=1 Tax=Cellulomonas sp. NPDC057328 TaxID=3346101 RepID=UPI0036426A5F